MKRAFRIRPVRLPNFKCVVLSFLLIVVGIASAQTITTNSLQLGIPLKELLKKWEGSSLDAIQQAAKDGDLTAQHYLGYCYMEGFRVAKNPAVGVTWYERAFQGGYLPSANNLGFIYQRGQLGTPDLAKAIYYYRYAAEKGLPLAQLNLGLLYEKEGQPERAFQLYQQAAEQGQAGAMIQLYRCYWIGIGVIPDHAQAMQWLLKAAEANNPSAQYLMGYRYENRELEGSGAERQLLPSNMSEAVRWYRRAADQGWADGQYHLGLCYLKGTGVEQDEERGLELIRAAADREHSQAMYELVNLYAKGIGAPRNAQDKPMQLLQRFAKLMAPNSIGGSGYYYDDIVFRYQNGLGTDRDLVAAAQWYCRAALAGMANHSLEDKFDRTPPKSGLTGDFTSSPDRNGGFVRSGGGSDQLLRALSIYLKASLKNADALMQIGNMYFAGKDAPKSSAKAWLWFTLADQNGSSDARVKISEAEARMSGDELKEAKQLLPDLIQELNKVATVIRSSGSRPRTNL